MKPVHNSPPLMKNSSRSSANQVSLSPRKLDAVLADSSSLQASQHRPGWGGVPSAHGSQSRASCTRPPPSYAFDDKRHERFLASGAAGFSRRRKRASKAAKDYRRSGNPAEPA